MVDIINDIQFLLRRFAWTDVLDIFLVTVFFFIILWLLRDTEAMVLLRGAIFVVILFALITTLIDLPAFSWLMSAIVPAMVFIIPVIFAPELRRALERVGRAGNMTTLFVRKQSSHSREIMLESLNAIVKAAVRLSERQHGALIVLQREQFLMDYVRTGVQMNAKVTPELLLQIFYPNTPLHDGAVIIIDNLITAASCVMPLSASGVLNQMPDRKMGLRHRAALGISEVSDAIAVVVSEETGSISIAHSGRLIRRLNAERLENTLIAFFEHPELVGEANFIQRIFKKKPKRSVSHKERNPE